MPVLSRISACAYYRVCGNSPSDSTYPKAHNIAVYAAISGASLSLLETGIDSLFDVGSNFLLFWLHRKAEKLDINKWPVGGARVTTIGNIVYGISIRPSFAIISDLLFRLFV
jgi:divalent metal cation (Fe/Co/Zn/Cd) transporter